MKHFSYLVCLLFLLLFGCQTDVQKSYEFVERYNNSASYFQNSLIYGTSAKINKDKISKGEISIEIDIDLKLKKEESENDLGVKMLPKAIANLLLEEDIKDVIEDGGKIELTFRSFDNFIVDQLTIDQKSLTELTSENNSLQNSKYQGVPPKNEELVAIIALLNRSLPVENADKTKILKFSLENNSLVCKVEIPDDIVTIMKNDAAKNLIKENILREGRLKDILRQKSKYGIDKIIYKYQDPRGKFISEISID